VARHREFGIEQTARDSTEQIFAHFGGGKMGLPVVPSSMVFSPGTLLRWLAAICLAVSVGMVVAGESLLKERLQAEAFIYYWLVCIIFTFLTMVIALMDYWMVRRRLHREQRELFREALQAIARAGGNTEEHEQWSRGDF
jgi:hypothetical protein